MTIQAELASLNPFIVSLKADPLPEVGQWAPSLGEIEFPRMDKKPAVVLFLRHCGCPFAEKSFTSLRNEAAQNSAVHIIAVSHSDRSATDNWLDAVGGAENVEVIVDAERRIYAGYGLPIAGVWHALNPWVIVSALRLWRSESISNRPTESGSRFQTGGIFAVSEEGKVVYRHVDQAADDMSDVDAAVAALRRE